MTITIHDLRALEVLDSRGRPTLQVRMTVDRDQIVAAGVPSGASTGSREAKELRDGDRARFGGSGVRAAAGNVSGPIAEALLGRTFADQSALDATLIELDGTDTKEALGANAIIGVSLAGARAFAASSSVPLWSFLRSQTRTPATARMPVPHFNVVNGGAHAPNELDFQEFMIAPVGAPSIAEAVRAGAEVYAALRSALHDAGEATGLGDEGGFAPAISRPERVLEIIVAAIEAAGYTPGQDGVAIALDPAASEFRHGDAYQVDGSVLTSDQLIDRYAALAERFPIWSIEDGLAEDDWDGWVAMTQRLGTQLQLVGDDIFVTNPAIIRSGIDRGVGNAALIKVNQIGTVSETLEAMSVCAEAGYACMVSHRSGETPDPFIADLVVGTGCGQIKSGAPARGERVAKYNRLVEIEADNAELPYGRQ